ncbi:hypothetical protein L596_030505 [Steinernema carpocapsae]|uniref:Uncharacterized protein n=1 Tax=Steinernema carpocapsae TaxID=34508 RepID=A0A4U5LPN0_STECR|nr:hypothetical protein L596_030505 [Steinernema carpocapsae]
MDCFRLSPIRNISFGHDYTLLLSVVPHSVVLKSNHTLHDNIPVFSVRLFINNSIDYHNSCDDIVALDFHICVIIAAQAIHPLFLASGGFHKDAEVTLNLVVMEALGLTEFHADIKATVFALIKLALMS